MTDAEWKKSSDPIAMLRAIEGRIDDRDLRLIAVSSCRLVWPLLTDRRSREAVELAEKFADGKSTKKQLAEAVNKARLAFNEISFNEEEERDYDMDETFRLQCDAAHAAIDVAHPKAWTAAWNTTMLLSWEHGKIAKILRKIVGSEPVWRQSTDSA